jgi:hypothetical protein
MSKRFRNVLGTAAVVVLLAAPSAFALPPSSAGGGQPLQGGGCYMVSSPHPTGLDQMMTGAANGEGQTAMIDMLYLFYPSAIFCGY